MPKCIDVLKSSNLMILFPKYFAPKICSLKLFPKSLQKKKQIVTKLALFNCYMSQKNQTNKQTKNNYFYLFICLFSSSFTFSQFGCKGKSHMLSLQTKPKILFFFPSPIF